MFALNQAKDTALKGTEHTQARSFQGRQDRLGKPLGTQAGHTAEVDGAGAAEAGCAADTQNSANDDALARSPGTRAGQLRRRAAERNDHRRAQGGGQMSSGRCHW